MYASHASSLSFLGPGDPRTADARVARGDSHTLYLLTVEPYLRNQHRRIGNMITARTAALGAAAAATLPLIDVIRLKKSYPLRDGPTDAPWPKIVGHPNEVATHVNIPLDVDAREAFVNAFYQNWTLRLLGDLCQRFGLQPAPLSGYTSQGTATLPASYGHGMWPVLARTPDSTMVWWQADKPGKGGAQLLSAKRGQGEDVEIAFGGAETPDLTVDAVGRAIERVHFVYMQYLIDRAKRRLKKEFKQ